MADFWCQGQGDNFYTLADDCAGAMRAAYKLFPFATEWNCSRVGRDVFRIWARYGARKEDALELPNEIMKDVADLVEAIDKANAIVERLYEHSVDTKISLRSKDRWRGAMQAIYVDCNTSLTGILIRQGEAPPRR